MCSMVRLWADRQVSAISFLKNAARLSLVFRLYGGATLGKAAGKGRRALQAEVRERVNIIKSSRLAQVKVHDNGSLLKTCIILVERLVVLFRGVQGSR